MSRGSGASLGSGPVRLELLPRDTGGTDRRPERPGRGLDTRSPLPLRLPSMLSSAAFARTLCVPLVLIRAKPVPTVEVWKDYPVESSVAAATGPSPGWLLRAGFAAADYDVTVQGRVHLGPAPPTQHQQALQATAAVGGGVKGTRRQSVATRACQLSRVNVRNASHVCFRHHAHFLTWVPGIELRS